MWIVRLKKLAKRPAKCKSKVFFDLITMLAFVLKSHSLAIPKKFFIKVPALF